MWFDCLQMALVPSQWTNKLCTHDHSAAAAIFAKRTYFVDTPCRSSLQRYLNHHHFDVNSILVWLHHVEVGNVAKLITLHFLTLKMEVYAAPVLAATLPIFTQCNHSTTELTSTVNHHASLKSVISLYLCEI